MSKQEEKKEWGGAREGAGRPEVEEPRSVQISFRVTEAFASALAQLGQSEGLSRNQMARAVCRRAIDQAEQEYPKPLHHVTLRALEQHWGASVDEWGLLGREPEDLDEVARFKAGEDGWYLEREEDGMWYVAIEEPYRREDIPDMDHHGAAIRYLYSYHGDPKRDRLFGVRGADPEARKLAKRLKQMPLQLEGFDEFEREAAWGLPDGRRLVVQGDEWYLFRAGGELAASGVPAIVEEIDS